MSEYNPERDPVIDRNYLTSENVRARFLLYEFAEVAVNFDALVLDTLIRRGDEDVVDLGAADGSLLWLLARAHDHKGVRIGVEPNISQAEGRGQELNLDTLRRGIAHAFGRDVSVEAEDLILENLARPKDEKLNIIEGTASSIPLGDSQADIVTAMYMFYHIPEAEQPRAFDEIKRVLRPDGVLALATSGLENKLVHRLLERDIANFLVDTDAPTAMNTGFNTERAEVELIKKFEHVYLTKQDSLMIIDDDYKLDAYLSSLRSLRNQFTPEPTSAQFEAALATVVTPKIMQTIAKNGRFVDVIQRSLFVCSGKVLDLDSTFEKVKS